MYGCVCVYVSSNGSISFSRRRTRNQEIEREQETCHDWDSDREIDSVYAGPTRTYMQFLTDICCSS